MSKRRRWRPLEECDIDFTLIATRNGRRRDRQTGSPTDGQTEQTVQPIQTDREKQ